MLIDWFTVGAQVVNFLILVWLMKRFLYQPILDAIDARENRIAAQIADADAAKLDAQNERLQFEHKNREFEQNRSALLTTAMEEVQEELTSRIDELEGKITTIQRAKLSQKLYQTYQLNVNQESLRAARREVAASEPDVNLESFQAKAMVDGSSIINDPAIKAMIAQKRKKLETDRKHRKNQL